MVIEQIETDHPQARETILAALEAHNDAASGRVDPFHRFGVLVRDGAGIAIGGAVCAYYWDWVFVDLLWLPDARRGHGLGTRVMRTIEREASRRGCRGVWLDTMGYQAPGFYAKCGYRSFAAVPDWEGGSTRHWFLKTPLTVWPDQAIDVAEPLTETDYRAVLTGLQDYNSARAGASQMLPLGLIVRDAPDAQMRGGLWAHSNRGWMFVQFLGLPPELRGQGVGTRLMRMAEAVALERGCAGVWLDTFSFQARPFYERLGYTTVGQIDDYPPPHSRFFLMKRLAGPAATVGTPP